MKAPNIARSKRRFRKRLVLIPLAIALGCYAALLEHNNPKTGLLPAWPYSAVGPAAGPAPLAQGEVVSTGTAAIGGAFTLQDTQGRTVTQETLKGDKYHLLFFGFANCPDVCPAMLQMVADTLQKLPPETAAKLQPVFITVDPERDTPEALQSYVAQFDARIAAWRGSDEQLKQMAKNYLVYYAKRPYADQLPPAEEGQKSGSVIPVRGGVEQPVGAVRGPRPIPGQQVSSPPGEQSEPSHNPITPASHNPITPPSHNPDYTLDHSAYLYLFNPAGVFVTHFPNSISQPTLIDKLTQLTTK